MDIARMQIEFRAGYDKSNSLSYPDFSPEEIDLFINKSISFIVKERYSGNNLKKESVEETQKRRDDLRELTTNAKILGPFISKDDNKDNGYFVTLPENYWFALEEDAIIGYYDCHNDLRYGRATVKPITHDRYNKIKNDPFNKPNKIEVLCLPYNTRQNEIIIDQESTLEEYIIRYIRKPAEVSLSAGISCDLSEHLHREIIDTAVNIALENIESPRFQTQTNELLRNE